jgi:hypothetical protein
MMKEKEEEEGKKKIHPPCDVNNMKGLLSFFPFLRFNSMN